MKAFISILSFSLLVPLAAGAAIIQGQTQQRPLQVAPLPLPTSSSQSPSPSPEDASTQKHRHRLHDPKNPTKPYTISPSLFQELEELSRVVDVTYCVGTPNTGISQPFRCLSRCQDFPSFTLVKSWNTGHLSLTDSCGYVAVSHPPAEKRVIVAFRGTYSITNAIIDLSTNHQEYVPYPPSDDDGHDDGGDGNIPGEKCLGCMAHAGFLRSWRVAADEVLEPVERLMREYGPQGYRLTLVGHSLGGAVAALAALEFMERGYDPIVTTFGEPRVGNGPLAEYFNHHFDITTMRRITHRADPVPLLPLQSWGFQQHQTELYVDKVDLPPGPEDVILCEGDEDPKCASGGGVNLFEALWAHRDYFNRLGLCVPPGFGKWLPVVVEEL